MECSAVDLECLEMTYLHRPKQQQYHRLVILERWLTYAYCFTSDVYCIKKTEIKISLHALQ